MCYFVEHNIQRKELEKRFNVAFPEDTRYTPSFFHSAFSKPFMPVITNEKKEIIQMFRWGLIPSWVRDEASADKISLTTFNARGETVWEKPAFKKSIQSGRCLVSAHGFFEYHTSPGLKIPWYIHLKSNDIFSFAGIYDSWINKDSGEIVNTFSILTITANPLMEKIHNLKKRMPVILPKDMEQTWLNMESHRDVVNSLLKPFPEELLVAHTISKKISEKHPDVSDPSIIEKYEYHVNPKLF